MSESWRETSAAALGRGIAAAEIDPVELAECFLAAIDAHPDAARIYARTTPERARAEAMAARERASEGRRRGPLDGVPLSWKDLFDTAGVATEAGSRLLAGRVPAHDATVIRRAGAAGTVCLGKTHMSELAFSGLGVNPVTATPPNRYDPALAPGGSSSGAAVSVAAGLAPLAIGSDTGGSVRIPAAWNGLVGLKTTYGLIPTDGVVPLSVSLDTIGPLARTVEDAGLAFDMLMGRPAVAREAAEPAEIALYVPETVALDGCEIEILAAFDAALAALVKAGVRVTRGPLPEFAETLEVAARESAIVTYEGWRSWGALIEAHPGVMYPLIEARFRSGEGIAAEADTRARQRFAALSAAVSAVIEENGILAMPTVPCRAPPVARLEADPDYYAERNLLALRNTRLGNLLGLAAITLPTETPMAGLMLVGPSGSEDRLLALGAAVEAVLAG